MVDGTWTCSCPGTVAVAGIGIRTVPGMAPGGGLMLTGLADSDPSPSQGWLVPTAGHDSLMARPAADRASPPPADLV